MTKHHLAFRATLALALCTGACMGGTDREQDDDRAKPSEQGGTDLPDEDTPSGEADGDGDGQVIEEVVAAPEDPGMDEEAIQASCLTFYTADEGSASSFEAGL